MDKHRKMWDPNTCRICVQNNPLCKWLNTLEQPDNLRIFDKLLLCVPDLKLREPENLKICPACDLALSASYNFRNLCLQSESKFNFFLETNGKCVGQYASTEKLLETLGSEGTETENTVNTVTGDNITELPKIQATNETLKKRHVQSKTVCKVGYFVAAPLKEAISKRYKLTVSDKLSAIASAANCSSASTAEPKKVSPVVDSAHPLSNLQYISDIKTEAPESTDSLPAETNEQLQRPLEVRNHDSGTIVSDPNASQIALNNSDSPQTVGEDKLTGQICSAPQSSRPIKEESPEILPLRETENTSQLSNNVNLPTIKIEELKDVEFSDDMLCYNEPYDSAMGLENRTSLLTLSNEQCYSTEASTEEVYFKEEQQDYESGRESPLLEVLAEDFYDVPRNKEEEHRMELRRIIHYNPHLHKYHPQMFECCVTLERLPDLKVSDGESSEVFLCKCNHCGMTFNSTTLLLGHVKLHFLEKPVKCHICKMNFTDRYIFNKHVEDHKEEKQQYVSSDYIKKPSRTQYTVNTKQSSSFQEITIVCIRDMYCQICNLKLPDPEAAKEHWTKHCKSCLAYVKDITIHSKIHMNFDLKSRVNFKYIEDYCLTKFHCQFCSANLSSFDTATMHMEQHCKICYKFVTSNISIHTACHKEAVNFNGEIHYLCLICKGFFNMPHFETHIPRPTINPAAELALNIKHKKIRKLESDPNIKPKLSEFDEESDTSSRSSGMTTGEGSLEFKMNTERGIEVNNKEETKIEIVYPPNVSPSQISLQIPSDIKCIRKNMVIDPIVEILSAVYYCSRDITMFDIKRRCLRDLSCPICCISLTQLQANQHFKQHCNICLIVINGSMQDHIKEHMQVLFDGSPMYMCKACDRYAHLQHFITHFRKNFNECQKCQKFFIKKDHYIYHQMLEHNLYECEYCGKLKDSKGGLKYHCCYSHQDLLNKNSICQLCLKDFRYHSLLKFHMWDTHYTEQFEDYFKKIEAEIMSELNGIINIKKTEEGDSEYLVSKLRAICQKPEDTSSKKRKQDFSDGSKGKLQKHIKKKAKIISFESIIDDSIKLNFCQACAIQFDTTAATEAHMKNHCLICFTYSSDSSHYKIHNTIKLNQKVDVYICKQPFCNHYYQKDHFVLHYKPRTARAICPICTGSYSSSFNEFCLHMLKVHKLYSCEYCLKIFNKFSLLAAHCSLEHAEFEKLSKCEICKQHSNFSNTHLLHVTEEHKSCKKCSIYFVSADELLYHKAICSGTVDEVVVKTPVITMQKNNAPTKLNAESCKIKDSPFEIFSSSCCTALQCKICDIPFKNVSMVEQHLKSHCTICFEKCDNFKEHFELHKALVTCNGKQMFYCLLCEKYLGRNHFIFHHREKINYTTCYITNCKKYFDRKVSLMLHAFNVHKLIICEFCEKYFYTLSGLHSHCLSKHTLDGDGPIICTFCKRSYICKSTYKFHLWKEHTHCKSCNVSFETVNLIDSHKCFKKISPETVVSEISTKLDTPCSECKQVFPTKEDCVLHVFNEHKAYLCDVCGKHCNCLAGINGHYLNKHRDLITSFSCRMCSKSFSYDNIYKFHIWREHTRCATCDFSFKSIELFKSHKCYSNDEVSESEEIVDPSVFEAPTNSSPALDWSTSLDRINEESLESTSNSEINEPLINTTSYEEIRQSFVANLFCKFCNVRLRSEKDTKIHMEYHCPVCFKLCKDVESHYKCHRTVTKEDGQQLFFCFLCRVFHTKEHFLKHFKKQFLQCNECEKVCVTQDEYTFHSFSVHQVYVCESCGQPFPTMATLLTHCRHFHKELLVESHCKYCMEKVSFTSAEKLHVWKEHLTCKVCKKTFKQMEVKERHSCLNAEVSDKKKIEVSFNVNEKSSSSFEDVQSHSNHGQMELTNTLYKCEICKCSFSRLAFNQHMRDHITHK